MPSEKRLRQRENSQARAAAVKAARRKQVQKRRGLTFGLGGAAILAVLIYLVISSSGKTTKVATTPPTTLPHPTTTLLPAGGTYGTTPCPKADGSSPKTQTFAAPPQKCTVSGKTYTATMVTDAGPMTILLDTTHAPVTANNFVFLARYHFFDGLTFHRVISGFVDQTGDPQGNGSGGPGYKFADELPAAGAYKVGSLAMANSGPNTNGSQFFIIVGPTGAALPPNYSLFGMVTQGIAVAHKIEADGGAAPAGTPTVPHKITTVTITES